MKRPVSRHQLGKGHPCHNALLVEKEFHVGDEIGLQGYVILQNGQGGTANAFPQV